MLNKHIKDIVEKMEYQVEAIKEAYDLLYMLDVENKKDTKEYEYARMTLKSCLDLEEEYLSNLFCRENAEEVYKYFCQKYKMDICLEINPLADEKTLKHARTMNKIYTHFLKMVPDEVYEGFPFLNSYYQLAINLDLLRLTISLIDNENKEALRLKYNLSFIIKEIEKEGLDKNFEIDKNPYLTRNMLMYNEVLKEKGSFLTNSFMINTLRVYLDSLFTFEKGFEIDPVSYTDFLFVTSSIRACFVMLDSASANLVINKIIEFLNGEGDFDLPEYPNFNREFLISLLEELENSLETYEDAEYIIEIIKILLDYYDIDKTIPRHLSLKL